MFTQRWKGNYMWDIDRKECVDLTYNLGTVTLGDGDIEINHAALRKLIDGAADPHE